VSTLLLIRHGETDLAGRFCGQIDPALNRNGRRQVAIFAATLATQLAEELAPLQITRIISSPLRRARQTAEAIAQTLQLQVQFDAGLCEIGFGEWEGLHWTEIEARWPQEARRWAEEFPHRPAPGGETFGDFCRRIDTCFASLTANLREPAAIVTHRGVLQHLLTRRFGFDAQQARDVSAPYCAHVLLKPPAER